ncbi:MAG: HAMP domain-containing histidine kinase [Patescibacteria group bacterium]|nr:HAMP domain-containing histidine kinase [Patescibacteria group bacterium]
MNELTLITLGYAVSMAVTLGFGFFVLFQNPRGGANRLFFLMCLSLAGFQLSFMLGAHAAPGALAYWLWFANIVDVFMALFYLHFIILALDALSRFRSLLRLAYVAGIGIIVAACVAPHAFLPRVVPKLYFMSYLDGGPLYAAMLAFFLVSFLLSFLVMFLERTRHSDEGKRRIDYYVFSLFYGFATGITAFPLVFSVPLDPIPSVLIGTFTIPMVYGMITKDLLDIRIVFRRTLFYTLVIAAIAGLLSALSVASNVLSARVPGFTFFALPLVTAVAAVTAGAIYWRKAEEAERLKYEFITVAAHKFRTPLTRIRWASEALLPRTDIPPDALELLRRIKESDLELIQLSNLLMDAARMDKENYVYEKSEVALVPLVESVLDTYQSAIADKHIALTFTPPPTLPEIRGDKERLASAVSVLVENAVAYTPPGGSIRVTLAFSLDEVRFAITDSGIGVAESERRHIFKKFYRTDRARRADTEGVGLGLHMAENIIKRHRGSIGVESPGIGQGSTFWFTLPVPAKRFASATAARGA